MLDHWERFECKYSEATVLSQALEAALVINKEPLLCNNVPGRLWKEHSPRAFLPSCTGCLRYPKSWQDAIGGWSLGQSQGYVRTTRRRIEQMQSKVAKMLRESEGAQFGETELEEELLEVLRRRNFPKETIEEQGRRFARATRFVREENKKKENEVNKMETESVGDGSEASAEASEEAELEVSEEDGRRWAGQAELEKIEDELHGTPRAEETQGETDRTSTLIAEDAQEKLKELRTDTLQAENAQEELKELKKEPFLKEKRRFAKSAKTPQLVSSSKVQKQPASPKTPQITSSSKVARQPASPKLLAAQLHTPKVEIVTAQSDKSNRQGRPKGIIETRPRPSLKRHEGAGQDQPQVHETVPRSAAFSRVRPLLPPLLV